MASMSTAFLFSLVSLISASPYPQLAARQQAISQCPSGAPGFATIGASCIRSGGSAFIRSLCGSYPPLTTVTESITATTTEAFTITSGAQTVYTPPPFSRTVLSTAYLNTTTTTTKFVTATNGTRTTHVATNTITDTITATQYTCPITSLVGLVARQAASSDALAAPSCLPNYTDERGREGIRDACSCLIAAQSTGTTTITLAVDTATVSATETVLGTTTIRGTTIYTNTTTAYGTAYGTAFSTDTVTTTVPHITAHVSTSTLRTTVTTILPSPTPSRFRLYFNSSSGSKHYAGKVPAPGDPTIAELGFSNISTRAAGDVFTLNRNNELVDVTFGRTITTRNKQDAYPFLFLNREEDLDGDSSLIIPTCSVCSDVLTCGSQSQFAVCLSQQLLTLGPVGNWAGNATGEGTCRFVMLGLEAASGDGGNGTGITTAISLPAIRGMY